MTSNRSAIGLAGDVGASPNAAAPSTSAAHFARVRIRSTGIVGDQRRASSKTKHDEGSHDVLNAETRSRTLGTAVRHSGARSATRTGSTAPHPHAHDGGMPASAPTPCLSPRAAEHTVLHQVVRMHLATFLRAAEEGWRSAFVEREFPSRSIVCRPERVAGAVSVAGACENCLRGVSVVVWRGQCGSGA